MSIGVQRRRERIDRAPLVDYHESSQDPRTVQVAAKQSIIPGAKARRVESMHGRSPQSIRTSLLPAGSDFTDNGSLAGLSNASSSGAAESVSSSQGRRCIERTARLLTPDNAGVLTTVRLPFFRDPQRDPPELQCPFNFLRCTRHYAMENMTEWFEHSLSHFIKDGDSRRQPINPPTSSGCCFCDMRFHNADGIACWTGRMNHVAWHHFSGHSLAHARPDFRLFRYLYENGIIGNAEYRELGTLGQQTPRGPQNLPTPPDSPNDSQPGIVTELNERRRNRNA